VFLFLLKINGHRKKMSYFGEVISEPPPEVLNSKLENLAKQDAEKKTKSSSSRRRNEGSTGLTSIRFGKFNDMTITDPKQQAIAARSTDETGDSTFESTLTKSLREENNRPSVLASIESGHEEQISKDMIVIGEEQMDLKHFVSTTGLIIDWSPIFWRLDFLPHRKFSFHLQDTLEKFNSGENRNDMIILEGERFWDSFKTQQEDRFFLSALLQELHIFRQSYKTYTPFVFTARAHSDLPFSVSVISQCSHHSDGITMVMDACNQKTKRSKNGNLYPIMFDIHPSSKLSKEEVVTDFRIPFSLDSIKTAFLMNIDKVRDSYRDIKAHTGRVVMFIRENSVLQQIIEALSNVNSPAFERVKIVASQLLEEMNKAQKMKLTAEDDTLWFSHLSPDNVYEIVNFIERITNSIPKYKHLALKVIPEGNAKWTDHTTWSRRYARESALDTFVPTIATENGGKITKSTISENISKTVLFNIWIEMTVYFI
jgi:hypothetical protein